MTQLLSHASQSSLGETCAFYLAYAKNNIPTSLNTIQDKFVSTLLSAEVPLPLRSLTPPQHWISEHPFTADKSTLVLTLLACAIAVAIMSWRAPFSNIFRRSPQYSTISNTPQVSESDYSYITPNGIVDAPTGAYGGQDDAEPDTLVLRHKRVAHELHFPAYAINDGALSVGQLRRRAAEAMKTPDPKRIKLLYKGKLLDDDSLSCRAEGLKQQSEVMCVVSEVQPGESTPSEGSDAEDKTSDSARPDEAPRKRNRTRNKNKKKNKNKNKRSDDGVADPNTLHPPADQQRPSSASNPSGMPASSPNLNAFPTSPEKIQALSTYLRSVLLPLCEAFYAKPPAEVKSREFEHAKLSEMILTQVLIKADGIETDGNPDTRLARRALIKEAQDALDNLDQVKKAEAEKA
ncbi:BAG domain-containing protein [Aspergillus leporis]|jgi:hypothetical protein|uniref:BAG domain-containing protein n=1 Tax=Aspergillus leporis TaxID=41062 RepID=A0A5N5XCQ7_9EURO|nr:BAG domain-containing protein [Aspergillus leporis]